MKKVVFLSTPFLLLAILLLSPKPHAEAGGGWVVKSTHAPYRIDNACTDGVQITVVVDEDNIPGGQFGDNGGDTVNLEPVYLFAGDYLAEKANDPDNIFLNREYLQTLYPARTFIISTTEQQPEPINYNGDSFLYETFILPFYTPATVGSSVLVNNASGQSFVDDNVLAIGDCRFFSYSAAESADIPAAQIAAIATNFNPEGMTFTVKSVPPTGDITLNGSSPLATKDTFTLAQLLQTKQSLNYAPTGPGFEDGTFTVEVNGIMRVSLDSAGSELDDHSTYPSISADGQSIAFESGATNTKRDNSGTLEDTNGFNHIYRYQLGDQSLSPVSYLLPSGGFGNADSERADVSPDGQGVAFVSEATNLLSGLGSYCFGDHPNWQDTNGEKDVYLAHQGNILRPSMFRFDDPNNSFNCQQLSTESADPTAADMRARRDGTNFRRQFVAFLTEQPINAPEYTDSNGTEDLILFGETRTEWITSVPTPFIIVPNNSPKAVQAPKKAPDGKTLSPEISADAHVIVFESEATDLLKSIGGFNLDNNGVTDIYASRWTGTRWSTTRVSISSARAEADRRSFAPTVSKNGDHIAFASFASNFDTRATGIPAQIFVRDQAAGCTTLISTNAQGIVGNSTSTAPSISGDGRFITFLSSATNLVSDDEDLHRDIFLVDRDADGDGSFYTDKACTPGLSSIRKVSIAADGTRANGSSNNPEISLNGEFVTFSSSASNLVPNDTNGKRDIFVFYLGYERTISFTGIDEKQVFLPLMIFD